MADGPKINMVREFFLGLDRLIATMVEIIVWPARVSRLGYEFLKRHQLRWAVTGGIGLAVAALVAGLSYLGGDSWWSTKNSEIVRNYGLVLAALGAGGLAVWRSIINQRQAHTAEQSQITYRYTEAVKMLADDNARTRVGAVFALARIAQDSVDRDHIPVMEVLSEFVRNPPYSKEADARAEARKQAVEAIEIGAKTADEIVVFPTIPCPDIHAALKVIAERNDTQRARETAVAFRLTLSGAQLVGYNLEYADFIGADLIRADLTRADLSGADLSGANLTGAKLTGADLIGAGLFLTNLSGADLTSADLSGANLSLANLSGANLSLADLTSVELTSADLSGANLIGATLKMDQIIGCRPTEPSHNLLKSLTWPFVQKDGEWGLRE